MRVIVQEFGRLRNSRNARPSHERLSERRNPMRTLIALALVLLAGTASAMSPTETVQSRVDQALQTLGSAGSRGGAETAEQRRQEIRRAAVALFDFTEMSRRALGRHWEERTDAEKTEFVRLFTKLIARSYMGRLDRYAGEPVTWIGES